MIGYRTVFKESGVLMTFWSKEKQWNNSSIFLIMCHGCPSHPYDHIPGDNKKFLDLGYVLVYPNYLGTWGSDSICTFDNSVDSIITTIIFIHKGNSLDERSGKKIDWKAKQIILVGASFGGSVVLCAGSQSQYIDKIISVSPVIDFSKHNSNNNESSLYETSIFLSKVYNNLWRCKEEDLERFSKGEINIKPLENINDLKKKKILIIHDKKDPQILYEKTVSFFNKLGGRDKELYLQNKKRHILLHHLNERCLFNKINDFILYD